MTTEPLNWTKSSYSSNGGACVEWAPATVSATGVVPVRDSKRPNGLVLTVPPSAWTGLVALARSSDI
ncbi:DUF397 domain-containing protein [Streptomyces katsurahamanus]|uniref:DUF397 domain-containing protein n=1 Tax=Streptomyces katsurahamanus TaxID=2577098 RepID=A0ABW9NY14_9ACTN|nr:DUF397 domain-containing protein [Streptomyces katsurahamanus]MQS38222.1 DUF397 domain-containing protein [Streptomyces katsurahamanus]